MRSVESKEETEIKGIRNYRLKSVYAPVLDRRFIDRLRPEKTCISVCGDAPFDVDEDYLIRRAMSEVEKLKKYHISDRHGKNEHIGELSLFGEISVNGFMLESYTFQKDVDGDYHLILWFTPRYMFNGVHKHIFWYGKKNNTEWY